MSSIFFCFSNTDNQMNSTTLRASGLLLLASFIWGTAFAAQKSAMEHIGPFWFTALRFIVASILLLPFALREKQYKPTTPGDWSIGLLVGLLMTFGMNLQQYGIQFTSVTNSGFITGSSVVLVPIIGLFFGIRPSRAVWLGVCLVFVGMYFLSVPSGISFSAETASLNKGDVLTFLCAIFWAFQVLTLSSPLGRRLTPFRLCEVQFMVTAFLSTIVALCLESLSFTGIKEAFVPFLYASVFSATIAFVLQILAQRHIPAATSVIIISLESVFAAFAGWVIFEEILDMRGWIGCILMLSGLLISQLRSLKEKTLPS